MTRSGNSGEGNFSSTVLKALDVLECLAYSSHPLSVKQVSRQCGLPRPTAYRLLSTLVNRGYAANGQDGRYQLGSKMLSLSRRLIELAQLPQMARPDLEELCDLTGESVHLAVLDDTDVLYVDKVESSTATRMYSVVGVRNPLHCTSLGKAILAFLPQDDREMLLGRLSFTRRTPNTITNRQRLDSELDFVREHGYAIDDVENEEGIRCVGVPILTHAGLPIAAASISGPTLRMTHERIEDLIPALRQCGQRISAKLGYVSPGTTSSMNPSADSTR